MKKFSVREMTAAAFGTALIVICSWISVPLTVPITLQTFAVCLIAALLGWKAGLLSVSCFILLGAAGLPVFSGMKGGAGVLVGVTGGYILGFLFTALAVGFAAERRGRRLPVLIPAMIAGVLLCYVFGTAWFLLFYARSGNPVTLAAALGWCVTPYLIPDAVKILLAAFLSCRLYPAVSRK